MVDHSLCVFGRGSIPPTIVFKIELLEIFSFGIEPPLQIGIDRAFSCEPPKHLRQLDGDTDVFGDGSVTLVSTPGHTPGSQSLLAHLKSSGFIILSGDVVHLEENFEKDTVPSLNTDKTASIASMERIRRMIATYKAKFFINHDRAESDALKLIPAFYD